MGLLEQLSDYTFAHDKQVTLCNTAVIATDTGNYLIDTGMFPKTAKDLLSEIKDIKSGQFEGTFTTHYHFDHTGGNQVFSFKPIYAHKLCNENFASYKQEEIEKNSINDKNRHLFEGFTLTRATKIYENDTFSPPENSDIICYLTGGHTSGSVIVHYKPENIVFAGDNIFAKTFPWGGDKTADPYKMLSSVKKILSFNPHIVVPGHGPIQHDLEDINYFKDYMTKIITAGEQLIKETRDDDSILKELMLIPYHEPRTESSKINSIKHWIQIMKKKS